MKIYYVSTTNLPTRHAHGAAVMKMCEALAREGHDVELITPRRRNKTKGDPFAYYAIKTKFPLRILPTLDLPLGRVGFVIQEFTFAICAAWYLRGRAGVVYSRDDVILWVLSMFGLRHFVWESHTGAWNFAARSIAKRAFALVVISHGLKEWYVQRSIPAEKIFVLPSAIDLDQFAHPQSKEEARRRLGLSQSAKIVLYIGRLDGWKGSETLLHASTLFEREAQLVVIGGNEQQVAQLQPAYPHVRFLGYMPVSNLSDNQAAGDILVVPNTGTDIISARFTSSLKLVAHMASGVPIIASDLPSIRELVGDDAAFLVAPDDPVALASGIKRLIDDSSLASRLAARAREKVRAYTWQTRAQAFRRLLEQIR